MAAEWRDGREDEGLVTMTETETETLLLAAIGSGGDSNGTEVRDVVTQRRGCGGRRRELVEGKERKEKERGLGGKRAKRAKGRERIARSKKGRKLEGGEERTRRGQGE